VTWSVSLAQNLVVASDADLSTSLTKTDSRAMSVAIALFFMVGFLTCLNDIIIPHLKSIFELSYAQAMLVQFAFFSSYFVFSYPGGKAVDFVGYAIGSLLVNFMGLPKIAGMPQAVAANYLMIYWGGAMIGRFVGAAVLQRVRTGAILGAAALCAGVLVVLSVATQAHIAMYALLAVGAFNSIMFPSIFSLGLHELGPMRSKGASLMIAAIVGGAIIPLATGNWRTGWDFGLHFCCRQFAMSTSLCSALQTGRGGNANTVQATHLAYL
jgi:fucose permease